MSNVIEAQWAEIIRGYIQSRLDRKHTDILSKKDSKIPDYHEKQAVLVQLKHFLIENGLEKDKIEKITSQKNTGNNKLEPIDFFKKQVHELFSLSGGTKLIKDNYLRRLNALELEHKPEHWLDEKAKNSNKVTLATHVPKLTHPKINGVPAFFVRPKLSKNDYLCTANINIKEIDSAVTSAAYTPIATLLNLECNGKALREYIEDRNTLPFHGITRDRDQAQRWVADFGQVFESSLKNSHPLIKQVYFPISEEKYHLLCNVQSSSLASYLYEKLFQLKDEQNDGFKSYSVQYPNKAKLMVTDAPKAHANVSPLNSKRFGALPLLSCQPPIWKTQLKPPVHHTSWFYRGIPQRAVKDDVDYLRNFLLRNERLELSIRHPDKRKWLIKWGQQIIDTVLFYAQSVQSLPAGWSSDPDIKLKKEQQYFLDPFRNDDAFQAARKATDWQATVSQDFAVWLNTRLIGREKQFTPQPEHRKLWALLMSDTLRILSPSLATSYQPEQKVVV